MTDDDHNPVNDAVNQLREAAADQGLSTGNPVVGLTVGLYGRKATVSIDFGEIQHADQQGHDIGEIARARIAQAAQQLARAAYRERN